MKKQFKNRIIRLSLLLLASGVWAACGNPENRANAGEEVKETVEATPKQTPDVSFKDKSGKTVSLHSLKGKVVFINFWATWCPPCIEEMPSIDQLHQSFQDRDDIVFLMVDVDNKIDQSTAFMKENGYGLPVYTPASPIPSDYLGGAIPTTVIFSKDGNLVARLEGGRDYNHPEMKKALQELLASE